MGLNTRPNPTHARTNLARIPSPLAGSRLAEADAPLKKEKKEKSRGRRCLGPHRSSCGSSTPLYNEDRGWSSGSGEHGCLLLRSLLLPHQARPSPPGPQQPPKLSSPSAPRYQVLLVSITLCRRRAVGESPPPTSLRVRVGRPVQGLRGKYFVYQQLGIAYLFAS